MPNPSSIAMADDWAQPESRPSSSPETQQQLREEVERLKVEVAQLRARLNIAEKYVPREHDVG